MKNDPARLIRNATNDAWADLFVRLANERLIELIIWEAIDYRPCAALASGNCTCGHIPHWDGATTYADIEIYFPCGMDEHRDCGFFRWTLDLVTVEHLAERRREESSWG